MSFGWSAGDIISAINVLLQITQALNSATGSPADHKRASSFVTPITNSLQALHSYAVEEESGISNIHNNRVDSFIPSFEALEPLVKEFTEKILDYSGLNEQKKKKRDWFQRQYEKLKWHFVEKEDLVKLRGMIEAHFTVLSALYPKMIVTVLEFHESKSAERDADILSVANSNSKGIEEIYNLLTHMWELQQKSDGNLLSFGPDAAGVAQVEVANPDKESTGSDIAAALLLVEPHIQTSITDEIAATASTMKVDGAVVRKVRSWLSDPSMSRLWLFGAKSTTISAIVFDTARKRHRPVVAHSCRYRSRAGIPSTEEDILVALVYSLIYQLLLQLPLGAVLDGWAENEKFNILDGTFDSVPSCTELIRVLTKAVTACCFIIDGFQTLGHTQEPKIKEIVCRLIKVFEGEGRSRILLTSSGPNPLLAKFVSEEGLDRLDISKLVDCGRFLLATELMGAPW